MNSFSSSVQPLLVATYAGNTVRDYIVAGGVFLLALLILFAIRQGAIHRLESFAQKTSTNFDDLIVKIIKSYQWPLYVFIGAYVSIQTLTIPEFFADAIRIGVLIIVVYYIIQTLQQIVEFTFSQVVRERMSEEEGFDPAILQFFERVIDVLLWIIGVLIVLQNVGFNVGAVLGGLGIGGVALAFALQNILADIFASISIFFDRPFRTGDFIEAGNDMGTVEQIGIRSTRITSLRGETLIIPNKDLAQSRILNYRNVENRRISFNFFLPYFTPNETLQQIPKEVNTIIETEEYAIPDRATLASFEDWGLKFTVVYYITSDDYKLYMETQQDINLKIKETVETYGAWFAYPTYRAYNYTAEPALTSEQGGSNTGSA